MSDIALVTGAAYGIGLEVVRQLAGRGMTVVLTARDEEKGGAVAQTLTREGLDVHFRRLDIADPASVAEAATKLARDYGRLDVLVNNAAAYADWSETASAADLAHTQAVLNTNLFGPWRTVQAFLPLLTQSGHARVVNVSSGAGSFGEPQFGLGSSPAVASYGVSKAALNALTVKLAGELGAHGVLVNAVDPGLTATAPGMEEMGARPVPEGAASVVWAATLGKDGPTGGFFRDGQPLPW